MNKEVRTTFTDEEELLQKLRDENPERWKRLNEWHQQVCAEQVDDNDLNDSAMDEAAKTAAPQPRLHDILQTELGLLSANELAQESSSMLRRILQLKEQDTATDNDTADDERKYSIEIVESYHELRETNAILRMNIERERGRLRKMQDWKEQHQRVHETLQARHVEKANSDRAHVQVDVDKSVSHEKMELESQRLKDHFKYVAECIQKQREEPPPVKAKAKQFTNQLQPTPDEPTGRGGAAVTYWSLDQLIFELMERLHSSPEDPYLLVDVSPIDTEHVSLLTRCHMLESFKDDINMIKLIDYEH